MKTKVIALLLAIALVISSLTGCGSRPTESSENPSEQSGNVKDLTLSPENTAVTTDDGITVDVGDFVLDGEAELSVTKQPVEEHKEEGYQIESYDISLGDMHELDDFITIRIPYSTDFCEEGQDPDRCVGAKYKNEATGEWEDVLFEVDADANELVIYTDHLSVYGVFYVENESLRNAYITDVYSSGFYMGRSKALGFAERIAADDPSVMTELAQFGINACSDFFDSSDRLDNAITIATVGDVPGWLSTEIQGTNLTMFSAIGYISTCKSLMEVAIQDTVGGGADTGAVLNLIRDVSSKVTTYWADVFTTAGSGALAVGMGGVLIIDKMLTGFAEEAAATKQEDIEFVYHHFNESFSGFGHTPMTAKDWRARTIEIINKYPNDPEIAINALESGFRSYASKFFALTTDQQNEVAADVPNVTIKRIPDFTTAEKDQMIERYMEHYRMYDVLDVVEQHRCFEDFDTRRSNAKTDFYRKWYHTRTKYQTVSWEDYIAEDEEYSDGATPEEAAVSKVLVEQFLARLSKKDRRILELRMEGICLEEIAKELGYSNHSGVLKRIRRIGQAYEAFTQTDLGF